MSESRERLIEHVVETQATIRTCEGCGLCCTEAYNTVRIAPIEAERIAAHLRGPLSARLDEFKARAAEAVVRYGLKPGRKPRNYTCAFLEKDMTCALPFDVKPVACLAFNPTTPDSCDMDEERFAEAHADVDAENADRGFVKTRAPIPVAVLAALGETLPKASAKPRDAATPEGGGAPRIPGATGRVPSKPDAVPRLFSKFGILSRKRAEEAVAAGRVAIDGVVRRDVLFKVDPKKNRVTLDGVEVALDTPPALAYVILHKPRGVVTTASDPEGRPVAMDFVKEFAAPGLTAAGRLDYASAGLLLFTNDHGLADRLLDPKFHVSKEYDVKVRGAVSDATLERLRRERVREGSDVFEPMDVRVESRGPESTRLRVVIREGKNRQIRRQFAAVGHEVETLIRTGFGPLRLGALEPGAARPLSEAEISALRRAAKPRVG
jgi:23S rRNA pseudouridine2605 synthase